ncbi:hypothetical protein PHLGIDRAFT_126828 [Phlebiopsis gigantea 11061_1 CR5-6]|uniref:PQ-loop-domain-containing protein n=1 Tax=Phlebiopsis gigantea (strain 11061_1 CR5-6) TaxID=745531 RepID=A0A0C3SCE3_PHLG1|nr:hypothetical protein PHLGIDRAFT_126828 [Phlebiopsis gigantea 11061_1 CR5-6]
MAFITSLSDALGYASIGCWLGAQFPQVLENYRRQSVDGLAWPFLLNWMLGDMTNLIGCILTNQLPFQTYLAIYFCFVDVTLVGQFVYYHYKSKPPPSHFPTRARTTSSATLTRRVSIDHPPTHYRALSHVAANVAAAAALAAQQEEQSRWRQHAHHSVDSHHPVEDDDEVDDEALTRLMESFHSDRGTTRKKVSWSRERTSRGASLGRSHLAPAMAPLNRLPLASPTIPIASGPSDDTEPLARGRSATRDGLLDESQSDWAAESTKRKNSRASRKGAGMVFLGAWALFGVGTLAGNRRGPATDTGIRIGRVLGKVDIAVPAHTITSLSSASSTSLLPGLDTQADAPIVFYDDLKFAHDVPPSRSDDDQDVPEGPGTDYIIGRISAWICTTLYLTSRLPQIWKNYVRKSVDGLSMTLFVCAFMGNLLYVSSILTSPKLSLPEKEAAAFLKESVPYLLGSGGTLMFDITIVTQSFLYRPKAVRGRRLSRTVNEEEEGLLSAGATGAEDPLTPSRRRMPTSATEGGE